MITVISPQGDIRGTYETKVPKATPYFEDKFLTNLESMQTTLEFAVPLQSPDSEWLEGFATVLYPDKDGVLHELTVINVWEDWSQSQPLKRVVCEDSSVDALLKTHVAPFTAGSLEDAINGALMASPWEYIIGGDTANIGYELVDVSGYSDVRTVLETIRTTYEVEYQFSVKFDGASIKRYLHVAKRFGQDTGKYFIYDRDLVNIERTIDYDNIYTAIIPYWTEEDVVRTLSGYSPENPVKGFRKDYASDMIYHKESHSEYDEGDYAKVMVMQSSSTDPELTYLEACNKLLDYIAPTYTYTVNVHLLETVLGFEGTETVHLGDTVWLKEKVGEMELGLEARVIELVTSHEDPSQDKVTFSNFKEISTADSAEVAALRNMIVSVQNKQEAISSTVLQVSEDVTTLQQGQEGILTSLDGKSTITIGPNPAENPKDGDTWFTDVVDPATGKSYSTIKVWNEATQTWTERYSAKDVEAAEEAAEEARKAGEDAATAAEEARKAGEDAQKAGDEALAKAEQATTDINAANDRINSLETGVVDLTDNLAATDALANVAKDNAALAQTAANTAQTAAQGAKTAAQEAKTAADEAQGTANAAMSSAGSAGTVAQEAKTAAANARTAANNAQTAANGAATAASAAQEAANTAGTNAQKAIEDAQTAFDKAEENGGKIQEVVETVDGISTTVASVKTTADSALSKATTVETTVNGVKTTVAQVQKDLGATDARVTTNETSIGGVKTSVSQVKTTADSALSKATSTETTVNGLKTTITSVETTANSALTKANTAQSTADGNTTKITTAQTTANSALTKANTVEQSVNGITTTLTSVQGDLSGNITKVNKISDTVDGHTQLIATTKTTADSALAKANTAQSTADGNTTKITAVTTTANNALTKATTVETTVNGQKTTISSIQSSLSSNVTKVNQISDTVDGHTSLISSVTTTADNALAKANTAQSTADGNTTKITSVTTTATNALTKANTVEQTVDGVKTTLSSVEESLSGLSSSGSNLIFNSGFESDFIGWIPGDRFSIVTTTKHTGKKSLAVSAKPDGGTSTITVFNNIPVIPGRRYELSYWYKTTADADGTSNNQKMRVADRNGTYVNSLGWDGAATDWTYTSMLLYAPKDMYEWQITLNCNPMKGTVYWDDISLVDITDRDELTTKINTVSSTVDGNTQLIASTKTTADSALSKANTAQSTADGNKTTIASVTTTANSALTKANTAQSTADGNTTTIAAMETEYSHLKNMFPDPDFTKKLAPTNESNMSHVFNTPGIVLTNTGTGTGMDRSYWGSSGLTVGRTYYVRVYLNTANVGETVQIGAAGGDNLTYTATTSAATWVEGVIKVTQYTAFSIWVARGKSARIREVYIYESTSDISTTKVNQITDTVDSHTQLIASTTTTANSALTKATSVEQTADGLKTSVSSVKTTADSALSKATTTETTVNGLSTKITSVETTANSAVTKANTAQSTADGNKTTIASVKTTADGALSKATTVETTVNGLKTTVSSVETTAKSALTKATSVEQTADGLTTTVQNISNSGSNMVTNGGFENDFVGWNSGTRHSIDTTESHSGSKSLKISSGSGIKTVYPKVNTFPVIPGRKYEVSFWCKTSADANGNKDNQKLRLANSSGSLLSAIAWTGAQTEWALKSAIFTAGSDIYEWQFSISANHTTGTVWWDDISIVDVTDRETTASKITQLSDQIDLRVTKNGVINAINVSTEGVVIAGSKVTITGQTTIANGVIKTAHIADANISSAKIADLAVTGAKIANATITTAKIGDLQVSTAKIANLAVTDAKIGSISASKITTGTLDAGAISVINLNASSLTSGTISGLTISSPYDRPIAAGASNNRKGTLTIADGTIKNIYQEYVVSSGAQVSIGELVITHEAITSAWSQGTSIAWNMQLAPTGLTLQNIKGQGGTLSFQDLYSRPKTGIPAASGWAQYNTSSSSVNYPYAQRYGRIVQLAGAFTNNRAQAANAEDVVMGTLPVGFRPDSDCNFIVQGTGVNMYLLTVKSNGQLIFSRYRGGLGGDYGYKECSAGSWLNIACTYAAGDV